MRAFLTSIGRGLGALVLPQSCFGCYADGAWVCVGCLRNLNPRPQIFMESGVPIATSLRYDELTARIVLAAKEVGNRSAREVLSVALASSLHELLRLHNRYRVVGITWIPTSRRSKSRRGTDFLAALTKAAILHLQSEFREEQIPDFVLLDILHWRRQVKDQTKLGERERNENLEGALFVTAAAQADIPIVLVDDVITTGSTLAEAIRALRQRNLTIVGAATACASRRRLPIR